MTEILAAINKMKAEFSSKFDGILAAIENVRKEISDCEASCWIWGKREEERWKPGVDEL